MQVRLGGGRSADVRTHGLRHLGDGRGDMARRNHALPMRAAVLGMLTISLAFAGCIDLPFGNADALATQERGVYVRDVQVSIQTLSMIFSQADESVRAFQQGWLAPEGAASEFQFLHNQVKDVRADITRAAPPAGMELFHTQLGRSVSLTQQAMDAMHSGFDLGDQQYFDLAHDKLAQARDVLDRAVDAL
jgi:hypothetical protein